MTDFETRFALPDAPMEMPVQVLERKSRSVFSRTLSILLRPVHAVSRLLS